MTDRTVFPRTENAHSRPAQLRILTRTDTNKYNRVLKLQQEAKEIDEVDLALHDRLSENGLAKLREATAKDNTLGELTKVIQQGWSELKHKALLFVRGFWPYRDELVYSRWKHCFQGSSP